QASITPSGSIGEVKGTLFRQIFFCEVPNGNLAVASEGDLGESDDGNNWTYANGGGIYRRDATAANGTIVQDSIRVKGAVRNTYGNTLEARGGIVYDSAESNTATHLKQDMSDVGMGTAAVTGGGGSVFGTADSNTDALAKGFRGRSEILQYGLQN